MEGYLKAIFIFNNEGQKRYVNLNQGVNIVTGDSKTGKSALVEIIDYCLCSSRCTVPKGKITDFGHIYGLFLVIKKKCLVIARETWTNGGKMYFAVEEESFDINNFEMSYFNNLNLLPSKDVQHLIEYELGLQVSNVESDEESKSKKASLRNMVSYMFQHQNLMASKFALFYRFTDYYKRQDVINQLPIFAGFIGQEYYSKVIELNALKKQLRQLQKNQKQNADVDKRLRVRLVSLFKDYYALVGAPFEDNKSINELIDLSRALPDLDLSEFSSKDIIDRYNLLNQELETLRKREVELSVKITELKNTDQIGTNYIDVLNELKDNTQISSPEKDQYHCPLCGEPSTEIEKYKNDLFEASSWLDSEIQFTYDYSRNFWEEIRKLDDEKDKIISDIKRIYGQVKQIERTYLKSDTLGQIKDKASYAKGNIMLYIQTIKEGIFNNVDDEVKELKVRIDLLDEEIGSFNVSEKIGAARKAININMNLLAKTLDFEDEFRPINLKFDINNFDLYHQIDRYGKEEKIFLSEMGSGANWVSCHLALFLSLLRYFTEQKDKSPMPLIQFFDQPSQVYFPQSMREVPDADEEGNINVQKQTDIMAVNGMYKTIFDEVAGIHKKTGILPQIIIVDHVDGKELEVRDEFAQFTRRDWREGRALI
ncbi:DUF3732 domain-containing protein [Paenibacillus sp. ACRRX]|uniref:DUF3732 domain-containing protein n=1 Tax=Paenibacillus sp. ACRRX TaxID=2918206 RepID=UPI001EF5C05C|nr:DUF3732 domain-containing protein [Paenibacillus sp. ACRRX]MCG7406601.1 DUF3732 domain-containing protein [Paenibacillus sp. ACRRX]